MRIESLDKMTYKLRDTQLVWRDVEGEIVALDAVSSTYLAVNGSGAVLWATLATGASEETLVGVLVDACQLDPSVATRDVRSFIDRLAALGLLEDADV